MALSPNIVTLVVGASACEFEGDTIHFVTLCRISLNISVFILILSPSAMLLDLKTHPFQGFFICWSGDEAVTRLPKMKMAI